MMMGLAENRMIAPQRLARTGGMLILASVIAACDGGSIELLEGTRRAAGPDVVIATGADFGTDDVRLTDGEAAIAYDPDGCQVWIIDDGVEGFSTPRFDPHTGLPVCDDRHPPGTVIGRYETASAPGPDRVPRLAGN